MKHAIILALLLASLVVFESTAPAEAKPKAEARPFSSWGRRRRRSGRRGGCIPGCVCVQSKGCPCCGYGEYTNFL